MSRLKKKRSSHFIIHSSSSKESATFDEPFFLSSNFRSSYFFLNEFTLSSYFMISVLLFFPLSKMWNWHYFPHVNRIFRTLFCYISSSFFFFFFVPSFQLECFFPFFYVLIPFFIPKQLQNFKLKEKPETLGRWLIVGILRLNGNLVACTGFLMWNLCNNMDRYYAYLCYKYIFF